MKKINHFKKLVLSYKWIITFLTNRYAWPTKILILMNFLHNIRIRIMLLLKSKGNKTKRRDTQAREKTEDILC